MITEDYVSFEIAKLLKEKGFDEPTTKSYYTEGFENPMIFSHDLLSHIQTGEFLCPTLQMAMKWLREAHNLHCDIGYDDLDWFWNILDISDSVPVEERPKMIKDGFAACKSYEEACESAIKYCLENLVSYDTGRSNKNH